MYELGECFRLTAKAFSPPEGKDACLILVREMTELLFVLMEEQSSDSSDSKQERYDCSGCTGLIKFHTISSDATEPIKFGQDDVVLNSEKQALLGKIIDCPLFRAVPPEYLRRMLHGFREEILAKGSVLLRKGESNLDLYIVIEGELSVDDGPVHVSKLGPGEICGEMSYFAGTVAVATVTATKSTLLVAIAGEFFSEIFENSSSVQLFMAQLLADRLAQANSARSHDFDSSMQGRLDGMAPAELCQVLHMHQKTGVLTLNFAGRTAEVAFREGGIINASYGELAGQQAIFAVLAEKEGSYTFHMGLAPHQMKAAEIGDFMSLLMEGIRRVDEGHDLS